MTARPTSCSSPPNAGDIRRPQRRELGVAEPDRAGDRLVRFALERAVPPRCDEQDRELAHPVGEAGAVADRGAELLLCGADGGGAQHHVERPAQRSVRGREREVLGSLRARPTGDRVVQRVLVGSQFAGASGRMRDVIESLLRLCRDDRSGIFNQQK